MADGHPDHGRAGVHGGPDSVVLYPTWIGLLSVAASPLLLIGLGLLTLTSGGSTVLAWCLILGGGGVGWLAGRDFPHTVVIGPSGIERRCLLRRHVLHYTEVRDIRRAPARLRARVPWEPGGPASPRTDRPRHGVPIGADDVAATQRVTSGLLAAGGGRRRWMLTDQPESRPEYDALEQLLRTHGGPPLRALPPQHGSSPTSLYRRQRHERPT
jgi:hypothetical protein